MVINIINTSRSSSVTSTCDQLWWQRLNVYLSNKPNCWLKGSIRWKYTIIDLIYFSCRIVSNCMMLYHKCIIILKFDCFVMPICVNEIFKLGPSWSRVIWLQKWQRICIFVAKLFLLYASISYIIWHNIHVDCNK